MGKPGISRSLPSDARALLTLLAEDAPVTFQTFSDRGGARGLAKILHGSIEQHGDELQRLNDRGAGVFFMVNAGDGKGRTAANVTAVRALFLDLDGAPIAPVEACALEPHAVIESSPGRFHAYWLVDDCGPSKFGPLQKALAVRFDGDPSVHDLPRVMRLPGFTHRKAQPYV